MPNVMYYRGYYIYFWSDEYQAQGIDLLEPVHFHVSKVPSKNATKFWLTSYGKVIEAGANTSKVPNNIIKDIIKVIESNPDILISKWRNHFGTIRFINE